MPATLTRRPVPSAAQLAAQEWLSMREAAVYARLSERYVWSLIADGKLPAARAGRRRLVRRADLDALLVGSAR